MFSADKDASITAHIEYNIKLELSLLNNKSPPQLAVFVKLPQKAKNPFELITSYQHVWLKS